MKLYAIYTKEISEFRKIFEESIKDDFELNILEFDADDFTNLMKKKIECIAESIEENMGDIIIWSDLDIQFFKPCKDILLQSMEEQDICFMDEGGNDVNTGFMVIRCNEKTKKFFEMVLKLDFSQLSINEQSAINMVLNYYKHDVKWDKLPKKIWAYSNGRIPPEDIVLHHANCTLVKDENDQLVNSTEKKFEQLRTVKDQVTNKPSKVCVVVISEKKLNKEYSMCLDSVLKQDYSCSVLWSMDYNPVLDKKGNIIWHSNKAREMALNNDAEYYLFVDTDIVLPENAVSELVKQLDKTDKHIIGGWFKISEDQYNAARWVADNTLVQLRSIENSVTSVDKIDFGCMMLSRQALEDCEFICENREYTHEIESKTACQCLSFSVNAQKKGYKLWMDGDVKCKHKNLLH